MSSNTPSKQDDFLQEQNVWAPLCARVLEYAEKQGVQQTCLQLSVEKGFSVQGRDNLLEGIEHRHSHGVTVTVYNNQASGVVLTSDLRYESLCAALDRAIAIAKHTQPDVHQGLADYADMATDIPDLQLYWPASMDAATAAEQIPEMGALIKKLDKRIASVSDLSISSSQSFVLQADSQGFLASYPSSSYSCSVGVVAQDANASMQRDYDYTVNANPAILLPWQDVAAVAVKKTLSRLGASRLPTQNCPVIYDPLTARSLLGHFISAIRGVALYKDKSFLQGQLQQQVFSDCVQIKQMPLAPSLPGSRAFDGDGVRTANRVLVADGVLQSYLLGVYSGRRLGMHTTGNAAGPLNVQLADHGLDQAQLLKKMGTGLLVTDLMGQGVNAVTGDYSRGACGYWVENGEVQYPVEEIVLSGNLKDMFKNIVAVANDIDWRSRIQTGSILLANMTVAGS